MMFFLFGAIGSRAHFGSGCGYTLLLRHKANTQIFSGAFASIRVPFSRIFVAATNYNYLLGE